MGERVLKIQKSRIAKTVGKVDVTVPILYYFIKSSALAQAYPLGFG